MIEYTHLCIDKAGVGLPVLLAALDLNGIQTAQQRGIVLAAGSVRLQHDVHVFLWDDSVAGIRGRRGIEAAGNCILVRVRWPHLTQPGIIFSGTLAGDGGHNGPPAGVLDQWRLGLQGRDPTALLLHRRTGPANHAELRELAVWTGLVTAERREILTPPSAARLPRSSPRNAAACWRRTPS